MICARCDKPIKSGEGERLDVEGDTRPSGAVWLHKQQCPKKLTGRTYPLPRH